MFEYCKVDPTCVRGSVAFQSAKCDVKFSYQDREYDQCITDKPTPSASSSAFTRPALLL